MNDTVPLLSKKGIQIVVQVMREERKMWSSPPRVYLDALYVCLLLQLQGKLECLGHREIPIEYEI